jgi:hypothetical protein
MKLIEAGAENWRDRTDADMLSLSMMRVATSTATKHTTTSRGESGNGKKKGQANWRERETRLLSFCSIWIGSEVGQ